MTQATNAVDSIQVRDQRDFRTPKSVVDPPLQRSALIERAKQFGRPRLALSGDRVLPRHIGRGQDSTKYSSLCPTHTAANVNHNTPFAIASQASSSPLRPTYAAMAARQPPPNRNPPNGPPQHRQGSPNLRQQDRGQGNGRGAPTAGRGAPGAGRVHSNARGPGRGTFGRNIGRGGT